MEDKMDRLKGKVILISGGARGQGGDGATPWQTLVAATRHGAAVCGVGAELGTVEVGKLADLIVVGANPLEDITNVRRLQLVLKEGRIVSDKRHLSGAVAQP